MKITLSIVLLGFTLIVHPGSRALAQESMKTKVAGTKAVAGTKMVSGTKAVSDTTSPKSPVNVKAAASIAGIVDAYLQVKNALVADKPKDAAAAGLVLEAAFRKLDTLDLTAAQRKVFLDIAADAGEHAEHIGANGGNIKHQREHFDILSKDLYDLVKEFGADQVLYKTFCPMYNGNKGAIWLSESKAVKNPYFGKQMLTCGSVKEEMK